MCQNFMQLAAFLFAMTLALQTPDQRLGSFTIAGQAFTVIVRNQTQLEIRDASNAVQYQKAIQQGVFATAKLASGNGLAGLLMHYIKDSGETWQLFRLKGDKLGLFDAPMNAAPVMAGAIVPGGRVNARLDRSAHVGRKLLHDRSRARGLAAGTDRTRPAML